MGLNVVNYALANSAAKTEAGHAISGIDSMSVEDTTLTINTKDAGSLNVEFPAPNNAYLNADQHLILEFSNGSSYDTGLVPSGEDGFSPIATVTKSGSTSILTVTDATGTTTTDINDGTGVTVNDVVYKGSTPPPTGSSYKMWIDTSKAE